MAMHQSTAMQQRQHRKQLTQQLQHLGARKAVSTGQAISLQLLVTGAIWQGADQPQGAIKAELIPAARQLRMVQRSQQRPQTLETMPCLVIFNLAQNHRGLPMLQILRQPEGSADRISGLQDLVQPIAARQHSPHSDRAGIGHKRPTNISSKTNDDPTTDISI